MSKGWPCEARLPRRFSWLFAQRYVDGFSAADAARIVFTIWESLGASA